MSFVRHARNTGAGGVSRLAKHACPDGVRRRHKIFFRALRARTDLRHDAGFASGRLDMFACIVYDGLTGRSMEQHDIPSCVRYGVQCVDSTPVPTQQLSTRTDIPIYTDYRGVSIPPPE